MKTIINFLSLIGEFIVNLVDFVIGLFEDLVYMVQLLGKFIANLPFYFSWLPEPLVSTLIIIFGVVVVYKILGREG